MDRHTLIRHILLEYKVLVVGAVQERMQSRRAHRLYGHRWSSGRVAEFTLEWFNLKLSRAIENETKFRLVLPGSITYFCHTKQHLQYQSIPKWSMFKVEYKILGVGAVQEQMQSRRAHRLYGHCWSGRRVAELALECFKSYRA